MDGRKTARRCEAGGGRATRRPRRGWVAGASAWAPAGLLAVSFALLSLAVEARLLTEVDAAARSLHGSPATAGASAFNAITVLGGAPVIVAVTVVAAGLALVSRRPADAALIVLAAVTARLLTIGLKLGFERARPRPPDPIGIETSFAFPSGHSSAAAAVYGAIAVLVLGSRLPSALRAATVLASGAAVGIVAYSRVFLGVHHLTDVAGGVLLGLACLAGSAALVGAMGREGNRQRVVSDGERPAPGRPQHLGVERPA